MPKKGLDAKPLEHKARDRYCKPAEAPKRFKSAFIFFTIERHKKIREQLADDGCKKKGGKVRNSMVFLSLHVLRANCLISALGSMSNFFSLTS